MTRKDRCIQYGKGPADFELFGAALRLCFLLILALVAGAHTPMPAILRVPGNRKFHDRAIGISMQITARMVARAYDVIDFYSTMLDGLLSKPLSERRWKKPSLRSTIK